MPDSIAPTTRREALTLWGEFLEAHPSQLVALATDLALTMGDAGADAPKALRLAAVWLTRHTGADPRKCPGWGLAIGPSAIGKCSPGS